MVRVTLVFGLLLLAAAADATAQRTRPRLDNEPARLVMAFVKLETEGAALTDEGWRQIAALFTAPGPRPNGEVGVYEDYEVFDSLFEPGAERATVGVQGSAFGYYDPRTGRYHTEKLPGPIYEKGDLTVVRVGGHWRIQGPVPPPAWLWRTVLRHATALRDTTTDPKVKRHATLTVRALQRYH
jgi:hypothetical protein